MLRRLGSKVAGWIIYRCFIRMSRHVSFTDFNRIWNEAYQAHVEAEWIKMKGIMGNPTSSMSIRSPQDGQVAEAAAKRKEMQYGPTWPPQDLNDGQGGKPLLSHSQE